RCGRYAPKVNPLLAPGGSRVRLCKMLSAEATPGGPRQDAPPARSARRSRRDEDGAGRLLPGAVDRGEAGRAQFGDVALDPGGEQIVIEKAAPRPQQIVDRAVAGEDLWQV